MEKLWQGVFECWPIKIIVSVLGTCLTFLLGELNVPVVALAMLVIMDTFTRWAAIAKHTMEKMKVSGSLWYGIYLAIHTKAINSAEMRGKFQTKVVGYLVLLIGFNLLSKVIPSSFFGVEIAKAPTVFIASWLAFVELQSVIENLIEMGMDALRPLLFWCVSKRQALSGVSEQNVNVNQKGDGTNG